jgi:hypothetical protein
MYADSILEEVAERAGWDKDYQLSAVLDYIDSQQDNDAFREYLERVEQED